MSVEAITWALDQPVKHSTAKFVLVVLANCAHSESMTAYPSTGYLVNATGQDRKTVLANLRRLMEMGFITDTGERRGATKQVIVYQLNTTRNTPEKQAQIRNSSENGTVPKTGGNSTVFPQKESRFSAKQSQKRDTEPLEPSWNRKSKQISSRASKSTSQRFAEFWGAYPRKVGNKAKAEKIWAIQKLDGVADQILVDVANRIASDPQWREVQFIPYPTTYLNGQRWNDQWRTASKRTSVTDRFSGSRYEGSPDDEIPESLRAIA